MSTYKNLYPVYSEILKYEGDPASPKQGQVWFNQTEGKFKSYSSADAPTYTPIAGVWTTDVNIITANSTCGGVGTENAAYQIGTYNGSATQDYNGTSWSVGDALLTPRRYAPCLGTPTAAISVSGLTYTTVQYYNGSAWSYGANLNVDAYNHCSAGVQSDAVTTTGSPDTTATEEYNDVAWSAGPTLVADGTDGAMCGVRTAALLAVSTVSYVSDGIAWSTDATISNGRLTSEISGSTSFAVDSGGLGTTDQLKRSAEYDGVAWTNSTLMSIKRNKGACSSTGAYNFGGSGDTTPLVTEKYTVGYDDPDPGTYENLDLSYDYIPNTYDLPLGSNIMVEAGAVSALGEATSNWVAIDTSKANDEITSGGGNQYGHTIGAGSSSNNGRGLSITFAETRALKAMVLYGYTNVADAELFYHNGSIWVSIGIFTMATGDKTAYNNFIFEFNADGAITSTQWRWQIVQYENYAQNNNFYAYEVECYTKEPVST